MSTVAEKREFFLRNIPVNVGTDKDNEIGFPVKHKVKKLVLDGSTVVERYVDTYNRFLEGNVPTADVWSKLLHSISFKLNDQEDLAAFQEEIDAMQLEMAEIPALITQTVSAMNIVDAVIAELDMATMVSTTKIEIPLAGNKYTYIFDRSANLLNLKYRNEETGIISSVAIINPATNRLYLYVDLMFEGNSIRMSDGSSIIVDEGSVTAQQFITQA